MALAQCDAEVRTSAWALRETLASELHMSSSRSPIKPILAALRRCLPGTRYVPISLRGGVLLLVSTLGTTACTAILGGFDFEGPATTGGGGTGGGTACTAACSSPADCTGSVAACFEHACQAGCCTVRPVADGTPLAATAQIEKDCSVVLCDGAGATRTGVDVDDKPDDKDACNKGGCNGTTPMQTPVAGACAFDGGQVCGAANGIAAGKCVECNAATDCPPQTCRVNSCVANVCGSDAAQAGAACTDGGKVCDGNGNCIGCLLNTDCTDASKPVCSASGVCVVASCNDGLKNGGETDIDCGGADCPKCAAGKTCSAPSDCESGANGTPTCTGTCGFSCTSGYDDCDSTVGCETNINTKAHCGSCTTSCSAYCVSGACTDPIAISAGYGHTCAILGDGSVWCWGLNQVGEVGDGTTVDKNVPTKITLPKPATAIAAGGLFFGAGAYSAHTCAILNDKTLRCWGSNTEGELGKGNLSNLVGPQTPSVSNVNEVSVGGATTCVVNASNQLYCWGFNSSGQVGNGSTSGAAVPTPTLISSAVAHVAVGALHTCAVKTDGNVHCWGSDSFGQVGNGASQTGNVYSPWGPISTVPNTTLISSGRYHSCAKNGVGVFCWGHNTAGQLGIGNMTQQPAPQALALPGVTAIEMGDYHSSALVGSSLYMWGENTSGQLGDGTGVSQSTPKLSTLANMAQISLAELHSCGLTATHQMYCWGDGAHGKLGNGGTAGSSVPVAVVWP